MSVLVRAAALRCAFKTPLWGRYVVQRICAGMSSPALAVGVPAFCGISTLRWAHRAQCQNAPVIRELVGLNEKAGSSPKSSEQVLGMTDVLWLAFGGLVGFSLSTFLWVAQSHASMPPTPTPFLMSFSGLVQSAIYFMGGIGLCMTLVGIPFGLQVRPAAVCCLVVMLALC